MQAQDALEQQTQAAKAHINHLDEIIQQTQQQNLELKIKLEELETQRKDAPQLQDIIEMQRIVQRATEDSETNRNLLKNLKADHDKQLVIHLYESSLYYIILRLFYALFIHFF